MDKFTNDDEEKKGNIEKVGRQSRFTSPKVVWTYGADG